MSVSVGRDYADYPPYGNGQPLSWEPEKQKEKEKFPLEYLDEGVLDEKARRRRSSIAEGEIKHKKLGWKRLTVCTIPYSFTAYHHATALLQAFADRRRSASSSKPSL